MIRDALPGELPAVGELRVAAYVEGGFLSPESGYEARLRALGTDTADSTVLVAVDEEPASGAGGDRAPGAGRIVGTVMLQPWPNTGELVNGPGQAEIRALAVAPGTQGRGVGRALLHALIERAVRGGTRDLLLATLPDMYAAHRLYEEAGFSRLPDRDWSPVEGLTLLVYGLPLGEGAASSQHSVAS
jgi:ribosomal protein S18 acetylase RimI-like enzyme